MPSNSASRSPNINFKPYDYGNYEQTHAGQYRVEFFLLYVELLERRGVQAGIRMELPALLGKVVRILQAIELRRCRAILFRIGYEQSGGHREQGL